MELGAMVTEMVSISKQDAFQRVAEKYNIAISRVEAIWREQME